MGPEDTEEQVPQGDAQPAGEPTPPEQSPVSGQPAPQAAPAPVQPTPQQVQQVQQAQLETARTSHLANIGQMVMGAMGKDVNYSIDPQTGKTVTTVSPQKPGELFRRILAGALVGGAVGGQDARAAGGSPLAGAVGGAGAAQAQIQQQDAAKQAQAQQDFKNQQNAAKTQQDQTEGDLNAQLQKAQIAHANLGTLQLNQLTQGKDYDVHVQHANAGKANIAGYEDAGLKPVFDAIPEADMQKTIQSNPGASALDWEPTGTHEVVDPDGTHHFQYTYSAYDPKGKVPLPQSTLTAWKNDGFLDSLGQNAADVLQPDKQLDASQFIALKAKHTQYQIQQETDRQHTQKVAMDAAKLASEQALAAQRTASGHASEHRANQAAKTAQVSTATQTPAAGDTDDPVARSAKSVMSGDLTMDEIGKGSRGNKGSEFTNAVRDKILQLSGGKYDFTGADQEAKEFKSIPVQNKLKANQTLSGSDGKSGLLKDLADAAHEANLTSLPALNDVQAWGRIQSGSQAGIKAHQLATDVAEQYGSIFAQGGATSDAKIKLGQEMFAKNFNARQTDEAVNAARIALGSRMRAYADHNRFIRSHYGTSIPVTVQDEQGRVAPTTMNKVDDILARHPNWKRVN